MQRKALLVGNGQIDYQWMADLFKRHRWETTVMHGEFAARQHLVATRGKVQYHLVIMTDAWLPICMVEELEQASAAGLTGQDTRETGIRLCKFAIEHDVAPTRILCISHVKDLDLEASLQALGVHGADIEQARRALLRLMQQNS